MRSSSLEVKVCGQGSIDKEEAKTAAITLHAMSCVDKEKQTAAAVEEEVDGFVTKMFEFDTEGTEKKTALDTISKQPWCSIS